MDVSYLFWCSQETLKCDKEKAVDAWVEQFGAEVNNLKKELKETKEIVALQGLDLGVVDVGEATSLMLKDKTSGYDTEISPPS